MSSLSECPSRVIAEEIIERSPSVALRVIGENKKRAVAFITENIAAYGYQKTDFLNGKITWMDIICPEDIDTLVSTLSAYEADGIDQYTTIYRIIKADGAPVWINDSSRAIRDENGKIIYTDSIITDYTDTKKNLEKISDNLKQQAVLNDILQGLHDSDLDKSLQIILDRTGVYLDISRVILFENSPDHTHCTAIHEWCNNGISSMLAFGDFTLNYEKDIPEIETDLREKGSSIINFGDIPSGSTDEFEHEGVIAAAIFAVYIKDTLFGFICFDECIKERRWDKDTLGFLQNIAKLVSTALIRRKNEQIIQNMALTDQLTGLGNRHHLEACLTEAVLRVQHTGLDGYVLFIDMDDFKVINDGYGHDYGDILLKEFAAFLKKKFSDIAHIFRFGGDEFVILLQPEHANSVHAVVNELLSRAQLPWAVMDRHFYCTLSIGLVRFPENSTNSKEIIKNADIAMYQAKRMGKNNYAFYTGTLDNDSIARAEIEREMREAIDNHFHGFSIVYQPVTDIHNNMIGVEALVRWTLSTGRVMAPTQFVPLAEYLGLIIPIGEFVLREAAAFCKEINARCPDFCMSVNISIRQFQQRDFMERVLLILKEADANPSNIIFEITENMAMQDIQRVKNLSEDFRQHGIRISMDDFGTGYSSLGNMRELPVDIVKIDQTFIMDVTTDAYSQSFIRLITDLVHSMGRKVCIEGVETTEQFDYCREYGVDYVQGFLFCNPVPPEQLRNLINQDMMTEPVCKPARYIKEKAA